MKKTIFSLTAIVMMCSFSFGNTIEVKDSQNSNEETKFELKNSEIDAITICYERSRRVVSQTEYFVTVEITWFCVNHPEIPGSGTTYIPSKK
jgi:hypothetical protein